MLETHCCFVVDTTPALERAHQNGSNTAKRCTTTLKETVHAIKATIQKTNQTKYHDLSISYL
jgi:hypothetical protein